MSYYKITIINDSGVIVATYHKWANSCNEAIQKVLDTILLLDGDLMKVEEIEGDE